MRQTKLHILQIYINYKNKCLKSKVKLPNLDRKSDLAITKFIKLVKDHYGNDALTEAFLIDYFLFQFNFWQTAKTKMKVKAPLLTWCIGEKPFNNWLKKNATSWRYFANRDFKLAKNIKHEEIAVTTLEPDVNVRLLEYVVNNDYDERQRALFHNQRFGLANCLANDIPFNKQSKYCGECKFATKCMENTCEDYADLLETYGKADGKLSN